MPVIERGKRGEFRFDRFLFAFVVLFMASGGWLGPVSLLNPRLPGTLKSLPVRELFFLSAVQILYLAGGLFTLYFMVKRGKLTAREVFSAALLDLLIVASVLVSLI